MLEDKEKLKLEFDFLKSMITIFSVGIFGIVAYIFNRDLSLIVYLLSFIALFILSYLSLKIYIRIKEIYER